MFIQKGFSALRNAKILLYISSMILLIKRLETRPSSLARLLYFPKPCLLQSIMLHRMRLKLIWHIIFVSAK